MAPRRHPSRGESNKWYIKIDEYEYNIYPPFINAGAYVMSQRTMKRMFLASRFVKMFRFDDVYLGILAKKCGIIPYSSKKFWVRRGPFSGTNMKSAIASHLYYEGHKLEDIWLHQVNSIVHKYSKYKVGKCFRRCKLGFLGN